MRQATRFKLGFLAVLMLAAVVGAPPFAQPAQATNCTRTYCDRYCTPPCYGFMYSCNGGDPICGCRC
jgi:hypothetical protein